MFTNQTNDEIAADIEKAADLIRVHGLNKTDFWPKALDGEGDPWREGLPMCAYGALAVARGITQPENVEGENECPAAAVLETRVRQSGKARALTSFNDDEDTTPEDVIDLMLGVAKDLRNGEIDL